MEFGIGLALKVTLERNDPALRKFVTDFLFKARDR